MAARPQLQLFPPINHNPKPVRLLSKRGQAKSSQPKHSLDSAKPPQDLHELLVLQVDTNVGPASSVPSPPKAKVVRSASIRSVTFSPNVEEIKPTATPSPADSGIICSPATESNRRNPFNNPYSQQSLAARSAEHLQSNPQLSIPPRKSSNPFSRIDSGYGGSPLSQQNGFVAAPAPDVHTGPSAAERRRGIVVQTSPSQTQAPVPEQEAAFSPASYLSRESERIKASTPLPQPPGVRTASPAFSEWQSVISGGTTLVRSNTTTTRRSSNVPDHGVSIRSMFPRYDPSIPLAEQQYHPQHVVVPPVAKANISRPPYSPEFAQQAPSRAMSMYITPGSDLQNLWQAANGIMTEDSPHNFSLKMHRDASSKKPAITFGPSSKQPFYSLNQSELPTSDDPDVPNENELLIFRHHPSKPDILPIAHLALTAPPPPSTSRAPRPQQSPSSTPSFSDPDESDFPTQITGITPILATLQALDTASKSPTACSIATFDPTASSAQARKLAEQAVEDAKERESCDLLWYKVDARRGRYELRHPELGAVQVVVDGHVGRDITGRGSIKILNPQPWPSRSTSLPATPDMANPNLANETGHFINQPIPPPLPSPAFSAFSINSHAAAEQEDNSILASLDLTHSALHISAHAISRLRNPYLLDVLVGTLFSVALAEGRRAPDPGLIFAGPPDAVAIRSAEKAAAKEAKKAKAKVSTKKEKGKGKGKSKLRKSPRLEATEFAAPPGAEADEDLPKLTRRLLGMLGIGLKTAVFVLEMGVKVTAGVVVGVSKAAKKA